MSRKTNDDQRDPLSDRQVLLELAREAIKQGRSPGLVLDLLDSAHAEAPGESLFPKAKPAPKAAVVRATKPAPVFKEGRKHCPHCDKTKLITEFGTRMHRGVETVQSWCRQCRSGTNYHAAPRAYRVDPDKASARRED